MHKENQGTRLRMCARTKLAQCVAHKDRLHMVHDTTAKHKQDCNPPPKTLAHTHTHNKSADGSKLKDITARSRCFC